MPRALKIKCPTWDHVESFFSRKLAADGQLSLKLPFSPQVGQEIGLALELPTGVEIAVPCTVVTARLGPDPKRCAVTLRVTGGAAGLRARLRALTDEARGEPAAAPAIAAPPVPIPLDAPVDEPVPAPPPFEPSDPEPITADLLTQLESLRARAAHEILGVGWDASVADIRRGYFSLVKKWHPDVFARHRSPAIAALVSEVFIHINRAYDRMRDAAVAAGAAIAAGPALIPHRGWMAEIRDIDSGGVAIPVPPIRRAPARAPAPPAAELSAQSLFGDLDLDTATGDGDPALPLTLSGTSVAEIAAQLASGDARGAAQAAADALATHPRDRHLRALYHTACAHNLAAEGNRVAAATELQTALAHDPDCELAKNLASELSTSAGKKSPRLTRIFGKS